MLKGTVLLNLGIQHQRTVYELAPNRHLGLKARLSPLPCPHPHVPLVSRAEKAARRLTSQVYFLGFYPFYLRLPLTLPVPLSL